MRFASSILALAVSGACANGAQQKMENDKLSRCSTLADCKAHDGERVEVVGVYTIFNVAPSRPLDKDTAPVRIALADQMGPFLGAYWHQDGKRAADEKTRFEGRRVRVTGTFLRQMPPNPNPRAASMGGPCIHPVDGIELE